jgi:hypothetical protein
MVNSPYKTRNSKKKKGPVKKQTSALNKSKFIPEENKRWIGTAISLGSAALGAMGGGKDKGGGGGGMAYNNPIWLDNALQQMVWDARYYPKAPDQQVAGFTGDELAGQQGIRDVQGQYSDAFPTALSLASENAEAGRRGLRPEDIQQFYNPYAQDVMDVERRKAIEEADRQRGSLRDASVTNSAFGGSRQFLQESQLNKNLGQNLSDIQSRGLNTMYDKASDLALENLKTSSSLRGAAASQIGNLAAQGQSYGLTDSRALMESGAGQRGLQQSQLDAPLVDWQRGLDRLGAQQNIISGTGQTVQGGFQQQPQQQQGTNKWGSALGGLLAGSQVASGFGYPAWGSGTQMTSSPWLNPDTGQFMYKEGGKVSTLGGFRKAFEGAKDKGDVVALNELLAQAEDEKYRYGYMKPEITSALSRITDSAPVALGTSPSATPPVYKSVFDGVRMSGEDSIARGNPQEGAIYNREAMLNSLPQETPSGPQSFPVPDLGLNGGMSAISDLNKMQNFDKAVPDMKAEQAKAEAAMPTPLRKLIDELAAKDAKKKEPGFMDNVNAPLLQLGLSLMANKADSLGEALGEAGQDALQSFTQDQDRKLALEDRERKQLMDRIGLEGALEDRDITKQRAKAYDKQVEAQMEATKSKYSRPLNYKEAMQLAIQGLREEFKNNFESSVTQDMIDQRANEIMASSGATPQTTAPVIDPAQADFMSRMSTLFQ